MSAIQFAFVFFFAFVTLLNAQYLVDPYASPIYAAPSPYYGYVYGGNRGDQSKQTDGSAEKPTGLLPNPLDPTSNNNGNRQFPPMMPPQNFNQGGQSQQFQSGPPMFPPPIMPMNADNTQSTTVTSAEKKKL